MENRKPITILLTVLAYVVATFGVQGASHFAINAEHYASISIMRSEPIVPMGITAMIVQGLIFAWLFPVFNRGPHPIRNGIAFSCLLGAFLASYIVLGEAGKYSISSISSWIAVESLAAATQFILFGIMLGWLHRRSAVVRPAYETA